jgi:Fur family iron response transcriptional regulator
MRIEDRKLSGAKPAPVYQPVMSSFGLAEGASARDAMLGCPVHELRSRLREAGLRPTRQRVALGWLLFAKGDRHITAEMLYEEATGSRVRISLATVYNTLHQFTEAGLLREIAVDGSKTYFDTNMSEHHHFLIEGSNQLLDIPTTYLDVVRLPEIPDDMEVARVDVVVRLRKKVRAG